MYLARTSPDFCPPMRLAVSCRQRQPPARQVNDGRHRGLRGGEVDGDGSSRLARHIEQGDARAGLGVYGDSQRENLGRCVLLARLGQVHGAVRLRTEGVAARSVSG